MNKFKDNFSSESFYPDSNYYLDQKSTTKDNPVSEDQIIILNLNGQIAIGLLQKEQMEGLQ